MKKKNCLHSSHSSQSTRANHRGNSKLKQLTIEQLDKQLQDYVRSAQHEQIMITQTRSIEQARQAVSLTLTAMEICSVNRAVLESAFSSGLADFEDAIQIACAVSQGVDAIVTRDTQGFSSSSVPVLSIQEIIIGMGGQNRSYQIRLVDDVLKWSFQNSQFPIPNSQFPIPNSKFPSQPITN